MYGRLGLPYHTALQTSNMITDSLKFLLFSFYGLQIKNYCMYEWIITVAMSLGYWYQIIPIDCNNLIKVVWGGKKLETPDLKLLKPCFIYCYLFICIKMIGFFIVNSNFQETLDRGEGAIHLESRERETISEHFFHCHWFIGMVTCRVTCIRLNKKE